MNSMCYGQLFGIAGETELSCDTISHIALMTKQRLNRMPVQYIVGDWDFHNISVKLQPPVFIPRPETEVCFILNVLLLTFSVECGCSLQTFMIHEYCS